MKLEKGYTIKQLEVVHMKNYNINIINKVTGEKKVLYSELTEEQATRFCEMWGWSYSDENHVSHWLEYEQQN
jgi:hypothetical protein